MPLSAPAQDLSNVVNNALLQLTWQSGVDDTVRGAFLQKGLLANTKDTKFRSVNEDWYVFIYSAASATALTNLLEGLSSGLRRTSVPSVAALYRLSSLLALPRIMLYPYWVKALA